MKIFCRDIKHDIFVRFNGGLCKVTNINHVRPVKGAAFVQVELKDIRIATVFHERLRMEDTIESVELQKKSCKFTYATDGIYVFLDNETSEEIDFPIHKITEEILPYIQEQTEVEIYFCDDTPVNLTLKAISTIESVK